jgi:hypothetical protein
MPRWFLMMVFFLFMVCLWFKSANLETDLPTIAQLEAELARLDDVELIQQTRGKET